MVFIETTIFTKYIHSYLNDDEYRTLQHYLLINPDAGDLIQGTGGLRKLRWKIRNKGKRGGLRIIYYWKASNNQIYLLSLYAKNEASDLSNDEKKALMILLEEWK